MRAKEIFNTALMYSESARKLNNSNDLIPSQVLAALTLELLFKSIYYLEKRMDFKINRRYSHDFHNLFCDLNQNTQNAIISLYDETIKSRNNSDIKIFENTLGRNIDLSFKSIIKNWSTVFVDARYLFDLKKDMNMILFPELENILLTYIKCQEPEW